MSDFKVKFVVRAAIRLERGCLLVIEPRAVKLALAEWAHPVGFLSGSPLFARLSDCPYTVKVRALSYGLGGGEKRLSINSQSPDVTQVAPQVSQVTFQFPVKSLGHSCWPFLFLSCAWLGLAWLAAALPGGLPAGARGLGGRGLAGGWLAGDLPAVVRLGPDRRHTAHSTHSQNSQFVVFLP